MAGPERKDGDRVPEVVYVGKGLLFSTSHLCRIHESSDRLRGFKNTIAHAMYCLTMLVAVPYLQESQKTSCDGRVESHLVM